MDEQKNASPSPVSPPTQPVRPTLDTSSIYPQVSSNPSSVSPKRTTESHKLNNYPPIGVIIISLVILPQSAYGIWLAIAHGGGGFYTIVYGLQLLLGLGLLTLHEMARLIYVALGFISLALQIPALLFYTNFSSISSSYKVYAWIIVGIEVFVLIYLTRPSIKNHFG